MENGFTIVGLGELLWDMLPEGKQLGGAPANFAYHAATLGNKGIIASRVGTDELGTAAIEVLNNLKVSTEYIQRDELVPTGTVTVEIEEKTQPIYTIEEMVAWDYLEWTAEWETLAKQADAVCFGSLAQRSNQSYHTIKRFLRVMRPDALRVFDINLRPPFYTPQRITESLQSADIIKLNEGELPQLIRMLGLKNANLKINCQTLLENFGLKMVCLTRADRGSMLITEDKAVEHPGIRAKVVDAVGAGDAFTAALVHHYLRKSSLEKMSEAANRLASYVVSKSGATPPVDRNVINQVLVGQPQPVQSQGQRPPQQPQQQRPPQQGQRPGQQRPQQGQRPQYPQGQQGQRPPQQGPRPQGDQGQQGQNQQNQRQNQPRPQQPGQQGQRQNQPRRDNRPPQQQRRDGGPRRDNQQQNGNAPQQNRPENSPPPQPPADNQNQ